MNEESEELMRKTMYEDALEAQVEQHKEDFTLLADAITKLLTTLEALGLYQEGTPSELQQSVDRVEKLLWWTPLWASRQAKSISNFVDRISTLMWLDIDCGDAEMSIWIDPKDLSRVAGMLRSASEAIEALIEPKPTLRLVQNELQAA
jgi:hypothetical protein